jgi:alanine racemase
LNKTLFPKYADGRLSTGRLTIDLQALVDNYHRLQGLLGNTIMAPAVKSNAYGIGIEPVVNALTLEGCENFFVFNLEEAIRVKKLNRDAQIFVLNGLFESALPSYDEAGLIPILSSMHDIKLWANYWKVRSTRRPCALHVGTGANRLGITMSELETLVNDKSMFQSITPIMIMSHMACADDPKHPMNKVQLERYQEIIKHFPKADKSLANSASIFLGKDYHFDLARPGIALYGGNADCNAASTMKPVVKLEGRILQIRTIKKGETVGYGASFEAPKEMALAFIGVGYGDGYPRATSGSGVAMRKQEQTSGYGFLWGEKLPFIGRLSMDMLAIDVSNLPQDKLQAAYEKDALWVELLGENIPLDDVAKTSGTISYEILTQLGTRYTRYYRKSEKQQLKS